MFNISISNENGKLVTTSRNIAEVFGKEHKNVIRAIESLECGEDFTRLNFELSEYVDPTGRKLPEYLITRDGFTLLAMGFTGKEAMQFKLAYIQRFNELETQQARPRELSTKEILLMALKAEEEKERLALQVQELAPKAVVHDRITTAINCHTVKEVAQMVGSGEKRLYDWLRTNGYLQTSRADWNLPYQRWVEAGLFRVVENPWKDTKGEQHMSRKTLITGKGVARIAQEFCGMTVQFLAKREQG